MFVTRIPSVRKRIFSTAHVAALLLVAVLTGCATGLGSGAGVRVEADGPAIELTWSKDHPWARQFQTQPNAFRLHAQYLNNGKPVEERLESAVASGPLSMRFRLPLGLRAAPESEVCLFIAGAGATSAVPVRGAAEAHGDSARFRYPAWDALLQRTAQTQAAKQAVTLAENGVSAAERDYDTVVRALAAKQIASAADCQRVDVPVISVARPSDVVDPEKQADSAAHICVRRAANMRFAFRDPYNTEVDSLVIKLVETDKQNLNARLRGQISRFATDWTRWAGKLVDYTPEIGAPNDTLPAVGLLMEQIGRYNSEPQAANTQSLTVIVAGLMDSYDGCIEDARKQLKLKFDAWQHAAANKPLRDRLYAEREQTICKNMLADRDRVAAALETARATLTAKQQEIRQNTAAEDQRLPGGRELLNANQCRF